MGFAPLRSYGQAESGFIIYYHDLLQLSRAVTFQVCWLIVGLSRVSPATVDKRENVQFAFRLTVMMLSEGYRQ
jgi:hypothetical protein